MLLSVSKSYQLFYETLRWKHKLFENWSYEGPIAIAISDVGQMPFNFLRGHRYMDCEY